MVNVSVQEETSYNQDQFWNRRQVEAVIVDRVIIYFVIMLRTVIFRPITCG